MRVRLLDCEKIPETSVNIDPDKAAAAMSRRHFVRGGAATAAVTIALGTYTANTNAQVLNFLGRLLPVLVSGVDLYKAIWKVDEPTSGKLMLDNRTNVPYQGDIYFQMLGPRGMETFAYSDYMVEPLMRHTFEFDDGPYGIFPSRKNFAGQSRINRQDIHLTVT